MPQGTILQQPWRASGTCGLREEWHGIEKEQSFQQQSRTIQIWVWRVLRTGQELVPPAGWDVFISDEDLSTLLFIVYYHHLLVSTLVTGVIAGRSLLWCGAFPCISPLAFQGRLIGLSGVCKVESFPETGKRFKIKK